jgi:hypothetical protein
MGFLGWLLGSGNDHELAETKYARHESASNKNARQRREKHNRTGATRAARKGQAWEDADRRRIG